MSLNLLAVHDQIITKLRELPQDVYETAPPEDSKLKFDPSGMILPYIVVEFSDMYPTVGGAGIVSSKYDVGESYIIASCVAPTQRSSRQVADLVRAKLMGFQPDDGGELKLFGGGVGYTAEDPKPNRFISELGFSFLVNTVW